MSLSNLIEKSILEVQKGVLKANENLKENSVEIENITIVDFKLPVNADGIKIDGEISFSIKISPIKAPVKNNLGAISSIV